MAGETVAAPAAALHDAYAAEYDDQIRAYECYLAEVLFGLSYEYTRPGEELLDLGIGSGLSAALYAKAGLRVSGVDFSAAMLDLCRAKEIAADLRQHDLQNVPWPYSPAAFDHAVCCGVLHFIPDLEVVFAETRRVLRPGGIFDFTTKSPAGQVWPQTYERVTTGGFDVFSHSPAYLESLIDRAGFQRVKQLRCFVGDDVFCAWVVRKRGKEPSHELRYST
jgi:predicted TPR repeat methyltransferase